MKQQNKPTPPAQPPGGAEAPAAPGGKRAERLSTLALLVVTVIWGGGFIFSKMALEAGLSPAAVMLSRFLLAALVTGLVFRRVIRREYKKGQWKSGFVIGLILFAAFYIQVTALQYTTPANNAFITGAYVVLVPLLWWLITKKRPPSVVFLACLLSFSGVAILSINPGQGLAFSPGDALTLLSALLFAAQIVATSLLARSIHPTVLVFMQFCTAAALSLPLYFLTGANLARFAQPQALASVAYLGLLSTLVCYFLQTLAQKYLSSAKTGVIMATEALFGALFSVLLGYDAPSPRMLLGGLLMFASILLPELWAAARLRRSNRESQP